MPSRHAPMRVVLTLLHDMLILAYDTLRHAIDDDAVIDAKICCHDIT